MDINSRLFLILLKRYIFILERDVKRLRGNIEAILLVNNYDDPDKVAIDIKVQFQELDRTLLAMREDLDDLTVA